MANPWSMVNDTGQIQQPDLQSQLQFGLRALQSGAVNPQDAIAAANQNPQPPKTAMPNVRVPAQTVGKKQTNKQYNPLDPSSFTPEMEAIRNSPEVQAQKDSIGQMENSLNALQSQPQGGEDRAWIQPLLGLVDSQTGSNLSKTALAPQQTPQERNAMILKYQDELQKRKQDMNKEIINAATQRVTKGGSTQVNVTGDQLGGLGGVRRLGLISQAGGAFDKDPILLSATKTSNSLDRAESILDGKAPLTTQALNIAQQDFINSVASGGAATEGKVNREMTNTLSGKFNELQSYVNKPEDLRNTPQGRALVGQIKALIGQVRNDYANAAQQRVSDIKMNYNHVPDQDIQDTVNEKSKAWENRFRPQMMAHPQDSDAVVWAKAHPNDPRAAKIMKANGG